MGKVLFLEGGLPGGLPVQFVDKSIWLKKTKGVNIQSLFRHFVREARIAVRFYGHPTIACAWGVEIGNPDPSLPLRSLFEAFHLIMPFYEGGNLQELIDSKELSLLEAVFFATDIIFAVYSVHTIGVIHNDIKAVNVLLTGEGLNQRAMLADFGGAHKVDVSDETKDTEVWRTDVGVQADPYAKGRQTSEYDIGCLGFLLMKLFAKVNVSARSSPCYKAWQKLWGRCKSIDMRDRPTAIAILRELIRVDGYLEEKEQFRLRMSTMLKQWPTPLGDLFFNPPKRNLFSHIAGQVEQLAVNGDNWKPDFHQEIRRYVFEKLCESGRQIPKLQLEQDHVGLLDEQNPNEGAKKLPIWRDLPEFMKEKLFRRLTLLMLSLREKKKGLSRLPEYFARVEEINPDNPASLWIRSS
jgi:serine/threonine protein kinase